MAKYSTGGSADRDGGGSCELCGKETEELRQASIAGADLRVCASCAPHSDTDHADENRRENTLDGERRRDAARNAARTTDSVGGDSAHWEVDGTNYDADQLPYLVSDYGSIATRARRDAGLQRAELADDLDVSEDDLLAVEQGRAAQANVGGSLIRAIEDRLDVTLVEES